MTARHKQRPEALAQFAETARNDRREDRPGLVADAATAPLPTDSDAKDEAATKVLQEGVTGEDHGAAEAIERLPDRIRESRSAAATDMEHDTAGEGPPAVRMPYDATLDPRTGRPPLPLEVDELNRERELQQLRNAQLFEGEEEDSVDDEVDIDVTLEEDESLSRIASPGDEIEEDEHS